MTADELKALSFTELQCAYTAYLEKQGLSSGTINASKSGAFYLLKNAPSVDFWSLLFSKNFEPEAKLYLRAALEQHASANIEGNLSGYMSHLRRFRRFIFSNDPLEPGSKELPLQHSALPEIPSPCAAEVVQYLERALDRLFTEYAPYNTDLSDILLKVAALNEFYSTNIFSLYPVARHILALHIDERLYAGDLTLINDIKQIELKGKARQLYSFASKYCSHHNPACYPIYDSYIHQILVYFRKRDRFAQFHSNDLKNYLRFQEILLSFRQFYGLDLFTPKQLDQYLWQLGKQYFPKHYNSAAAEH